MTGTIGAAAAGLGWLRARAECAPAPDGARPEDAEIAACVARHRRPEPRARIGALLGRNRAASACMDLSDGLADAVAQIAGASGIGAAIDAGALPMPAGGARVVRRRRARSGRRAWPAATTTSCCSPCRGAPAAGCATVIQQARGVPVTRIGELTADRTTGTRSADGDAEPLPGGFVHF